MSESTGVSSNITPKQAAAAAAAALLIAGIGGYMYYRQPVSKGVGVSAETKGKSPSSKEKSKGPTTTTTSTPTPKSEPIKLSPEEEANLKEATRLKEEGNKYFKDQAFKEAIASYTKALEFSSIDSHLLYSNRSAAYLTLKDFDKAMQDAKKCIDIKPDWSKGYFRLGRALLDQNEIADAFINFHKGLKLEPKNEDLKRYLSQARERLPPFGKKATRFHFQVNLLNVFLDNLCEQLLTGFDLSLDKVKLILKDASRDNTVSSLFEENEDLKRSKEVNSTSILLVVSLLLLNIHEDADNGYRFASEALSQNPNDPQAMIVTALALIRQSKYVFKSPQDAIQILDYIRRAMLQNSDDIFIIHTYMGFLATIIQLIGVPEFSVDIASTLRELEICLSNQKAEKLQIIQTGIQVWFKQFEDPSLQHRLEEEEKRMVGLQQEEAYIRGLTSGTFRDLCMNPFFLKSLSEVVLPFPQIERIIGPFRSALLTVKPRSTEFDIASPFIYAVALQCIKNNYLWECKPDDFRRVKQLVEEVEASLKNLDSVVTQDGVLSDPVVLHHLVLISMFQPISSINNVEELALKLNLSRLPPPVVTILNKLVLSPEEEEDILPNIKLLKTDPPSSDLLDYYENHIAPTWDVQPVASIVKVPFKTELQWRYPEFNAVGFGDKTRVLVAACGSGKEIAQLFETYSDVDITAVDISRKNLAYAIRQNRDLGITDAKVFCADVHDLTPTDFPQLFDVILANDFLHYLADPAKAWRCLAQLLRPSGIMTVTLHNKRLLSTVQAIRKQLASTLSPPVFDNSDYPKLIRVPTNDEVREARQFILRKLDAGQQPGPEVELVSTMSFYTLNEFRDLIFHPQLRAFTYSSVSELVQSVGLEVVGFEFPEILCEKELTYQAEYPDDQNMKNAAHLDQFDEKDPQAFTGFYITVTCQKPIK